MARFGSDTGQSSASEITNVVGSDVLQAKAGAGAIDAGDVLLLAGKKAQLHPMEVAEYAAIGEGGNYVVPETLLTSIGYGFEHGARKQLVTDGPDGSFYFASSYYSNKRGCRVWRLDRDGTLLNEVTLDGNNYNSTAVMAVRLTNGNIAVFFYAAGSFYKVFVAVLSPMLDIILDKTEIATASVNPSMNGDIIALSGGGFAIVWCHAQVGNYVAIYDNDGVEVSAPTLIAGAPANTSANSAGPHFRLAELSNENFAVSWIDTSQADKVALVIYDQSGTEIVPFTAISGSDGTTAGGAQRAEVAVGDGCFCIVAGAAQAVVVGNDGVVRGAHLALGNYQARVVRDDDTFLVVAENGTPLDFWRLDFNGNATKLGSVDSVNIFGDILLTKGRVVINGSIVVAFSDDAVPFVEANYSASTSAFGTLTDVRALPDFCCLMASEGKFGIFKYLDAPVFGVALNAVPAGNQGALVEVATGPGGFKTTEHLGVVGFTFDHTTAVPAGNKGALYGNSVKLEGV